VDRNRARGTLLGQAIGDALGTTLEFRHLPYKLWGSFTAPYRDIEGKGPFGLEAGQVTDDTQLAVALACSLMARGDLDPVDLMDRYTAWRHGAFDVGGQTSGAISSYAAAHKGRGILKDTAAVSAARQSWASGGRRSAGNGSLMRTSPLAVFMAGRAPQALRRAAREESATTHADPRCMIACAAFDCAIAHALTYPCATPESMLIAASFGVADSRADMLEHPKKDIFTEKEIETAADQLDLDLCMALEPDPNLYGEMRDSPTCLDMLGSQGFVRVAFRLAFWELMHAPTFVAGLIDCVDRGGDADTNGAIAGALLGARFGEDKIPSTWSEQVMVALQGKPESRWWTTYHPRQMMEMVP